MSGFGSQNLCPSSQIRCHDCQNYRSRLALLLPQGSLLFPRDHVVVLIHVPRVWPYFIQQPFFSMFHSACLPCLSTSLFFTHRYTSPGWLPTLFPASSKLPKHYWFFETTEPRVLGLSGYPLAYRQWRECSGRDGGSFTQIKTKQLSTSNS